MNNKRKSSIKTRIILAFGFFAIFISIMFSLFNFLFAYVVEDQFFERLIHDEASYLLKQIQQGEQDISPRLPFIELYYDKNNLPEDIRTAYLENNERTEFMGNNQRHFHLYVTDSTPQYYVLAEVSDYLVVRALRSNILVLLILSSAVMLLFAVLMGYWIANRTTTPLSKLANLIGNTLPDKLPKHFAKDYPTNEIGILANSLENAMEKIADYIHREQHFSRDASHELRTPIAIIKGANELLQQHNADPVQQAFIQRIAAATIQMEQTVTTLLALARETEPTTSQSSANLRQLIEETVIQYNYLLEDKEVEINIEVDNDAKVLISQNVLQIILANLLSNAFQYTVQGQVNISFINNKLKIVDSGCGVEPHIKQRAFQSMVKGSKSTGFGIGLSIVNRLCEKYQLTMTMNSNDTGTEVSITF